MLSIKRLNLDSSWYVEYGKSNFIVDPWLIGSEIDGFKWLNEQWHIKEPVKISDGYVDSKFSNVSRLLVDP